MRPSQLNKAEFMAVFSGVFEYSPWIAEAVWESGLSARHDTVAGLHRAFGDVIRHSEREKKLALLRAHPALAVGISSNGQLTEASRREQRGAELDRCNPEEYSEFQDLNESYNEKFGFPFIMAVKGYDRHGILEAFRARLLNTGDEEFQAAVDQVIRIGRFRIEGLFN
jgi:2-oxo-4-hydroxy-4-carboxy-5-ureidoimidazoline decarboxylase